MAKGIPVSTQPHRTCVGCRTRTPQSDLLRVVHSEGRLSPDQRRELSGRGAYVHPTVECVRAAVARKAFGRALRVEGRLDPQDLFAVLQHQTMSSIEERRDAHPMNSQR